MASVALHKLCIQPIIQWIDWLVGTLHVLRCTIMAKLFEKTDKWAVVCYKYSSSGNSQGGGVMMLRLTSSSSLAYVQFVHRCCTCAELFPDLRAAQISHPIN